MTRSPFLLTLFEPFGKILLSAGIGYSLFQVIRGKAEFEDAIAKSVIGFICLWFYKDLFQGMNVFFEILLKFLGEHMDKRSLQERIIAGIQQASSQNQGGLPSTGEFFGQLWRAGVWGVVSSITELVFLISDYLIIISSKIFSAQVFLFFPIACGIYPIFPGVLHNLALYAIELSLWRPMLVIVHELTSLSSQDYLAHDPTQGLQIMAVELVAIYLIFHIPKTTHSVLVGALSGDYGASGAFIQAGKKGLNSVMALIGGKP